MKLLFCNKCHDVFRLDRDARKCHCGAVGGKYVNDLNAEYYGEDAVALGFANNTFTDAVCNQPQSGMGERFTAFVIPKECDTIKKVNKESL